MKPFLRNVSGKPSKSDITMFTGGLNTCEDKTLIRDNQMPYMWNMTLNKGMSMTTRSNRTSFASFLQDTTNWGSGEIKKMFATSDKTLLTIEKVGENTEVYELKYTAATGKNKCNEIYNGYFTNISQLIPSDNYRTFIADDLPAGEYTFSTNITNCRILRIRVGTTTTDIASNSNTYTFTTSETAKVMISCRNGNSTEITEYVWGQIESGDTPSPYEPWIDPSQAGELYLAKDYIGQVENSNFYSITECRKTGKKYFYISTLRKLYQIEKDDFDEILTDVTSASNTSVGILASHKNRLWVANGLRLKFSTLREYTDFMSDYEISYVQGDTDYFTINKTTFLNDLATLDLNIGYYRVRSTNSSGTITITVARYDAQSSYWSTSPTIPTTAFTSVNTQDGDIKEIYITVGTDGTAGEINITNANGDIKALVPFDDKLIILCERSMHVLYGDSPLSEINQFTIVDFNNGIGCISDETWTICNKQLFWLDTDMSVYRYNGAGINKVSEPYGTDGYASYGGIKGITYNPTRMKEFIMSSYDDCVYIGITRSRLENALNDTLLVYNTKNRVWWAEDGEFSHLCKWETDTQTPFYYTTDYLVGSMYNNDVLILNALQNTDTDYLFNMTTRHFDDVPIKYAFETKTWTLGTIKKEKTLSNLWFQANAEGKVAVGDYWNEHNVWDEAVTKLDENYLILGNLKKVGVRHNVQHPTAALHQGTERQRFIIPRMYLQKINAFSIRVEGTGYGEFYMMEKEWRIK